MQGCFKSGTIIESNEIANRRLSPWLIFANYNQPQMKHLLRILCICIISAIPVLAQTDPAATKILKGVSTKYKSYSSINASFILSITDQKTKKVEQQSGNVIIKGSMFNLSMSNQVVQSDGKVIWTYLKESNEVQISENSTDASAISPANIFTMYEKGFKSKYISEKSVNGKVQQLIELVPEDTKKSFFKVQLSIDKAGQYVSEAKVFDKNGNIYTYTIQKFTPNGSVSTDQFVFNKAKYPGVEVVDLR
jgi:outer membrane lipoprotein-sorting protein